MNPYRDASNVYVDKDTELTDSSPEHKAWSYFKELINNDKVYHAYKDKSLPIYIEGNEGGLYKLYGSGEIEIVKKTLLGYKVVKKGRITPSYNMPFADNVSTLYLWISHNEKELKEKWCCGNLSIFYREKLEFVPSEQVRIDNVFISGTYTPTIFTGTSMPSACTFYTSLIACSISPFVGTYYSWAAST